MIPLFWLSLRVKPSNVNNRSVKPNTIIDGSKVSENEICPMLQEKRDRIGNIANKNGWRTSGFFIFTFLSFTLRTIIPIGYSQQLLHSPLFHI